MRAIAVLLVMAMHFRVPFLAGGGHTGVAIFFALSGFLITRLLLDELAREGRIDFLNFYGRRARRLLPALAFLIAVLVLIDAGRGELGESVAQGAFAFFYISNWVQAVGVPMDGLVHTWSLSVEEQFYLLWPAALLFAMAAGGRRALLITCGAIGLMAAAVRFAQPELHIGVDRSDALMMGCLLAASGWRPPAWIAIPASLALAWSATLPVADAGVRTWGLVVVAVGGAMLVGSMADSRVLSWRPLVATGQLSYGLYLWHVPVLLLVAPKLGDAGWPFRVLVLAGLTFGMALISWRYVEKPLRRSWTIPPSIRAALAWRRPPARGDAEVRP